MTKVGRGRASRLRVKAISVPLHGVRRELQVPCFRRGSPPVVVAAVHVAERGCRELVGRKVVERRDVFSFVVERMRTMGRIGWVQIPYLESVIANGELIVEIDATDASQVNIFIPARAVKPLAKFSGVVHKTG